MGKKDKRIPVDSVGKLIKEAREKRNLTIEELVWKINKPQITEKVINNWEKGKEFPDLDNIYLLAQTLDLNPNEMLSKRLTIQDESIHEIDPASRRVGDKFFQVAFVIVKQCVKWIAGICIIILAANYKNFENKMTGENDPEQIQLIEKVIDNGVEQYTIYDLSGKNDSLNTIDNEKNNTIDIDNTINK